MTATAYRVSNSGATELLPTGGADRSPALLAETHAAPPLVGRSPGSLNRMTKILSALIAVISIAACGRESFTENLNPKATLMAGLESYSSREEVVPRLPPSSKLVVVENSSLGERDSRPPFSSYSLSVSGFRHLDQDGELILVFFNNRLKQTVFYPSDMKAYLVALEASGLALAEGQELRKDNTVIWRAVDYQRRPYVAWGDVRLRDQSRRWISRYE